MTEIINLNRADVSLQDSLAQCVVLRLVWS